MSEDLGNEDEFEQIVNANKDTAPEREITVTPALSIWKTIHDDYPKYHDGLLMRGVLVMDTVDAKGRRRLLWSTPQDTQPWEILGMLHQAINDMEAENNVLIMDAMIGTDNDDA